MLDSLIYQHTIGSVIFFIGIFLYIKKSPKEFKVQFGNRPVLYPMLAFGFYLILNIVWATLAMRSHHG